MIIVLFLLTLLVTLGTVITCAYAIHITSLVSGEKLLKTGSRVGYHYAMTYRSWQGYAAMSLVVMAAMWLIFIFIMIRYKKKS